MLEEASYNDQFLEKSRLRKGCVWTCSAFERHAGAPCVRVHASVQRAVHACFHVFFGVNRGTMPLPCSPGQGRTKKWSHTVYEKGSGKKMASWIQDKCRWARHLLCVTLMRYPIFSCTMYLCAAAFQCAWMFLPVAVHDWVHE